MHCGLWVTETRLCGLIHRNTWTPHLWWGAANGTGRACVQAGGGAQEISLLSRHSAVNEITLL